MDVSYVYVFYTLLGLIPLCVLKGIFRGHGPMPKSEQESVKRKWEQ